MTMVSADVRWDFTVSLSAELWNVHDWGDGKGTDECGGRLEQLVQVDSRSGGPVLMGGCCCCGIQETKGQDRLRVGPLVSTLR